MKETFSKALLDWYDRGARTLPWRSDPTPYKIWVSEMMLQQTRVDTVIPYFHRFVQELPGIPELSQVSEDRLLKLWQGLGYYNRALNLKKAAIILMAEQGGTLPESLEELKKLPGIGPYSAGAIASIAFGKPVPAVDGNVMRILLRLASSQEDSRSAGTKKWAEENILQRIPQDRPGDFNQALMDLGATICLSNGEPKCQTCPVSLFCAGFEEGKAGALPVKWEKKKRVEEKKTILVIHHGKKTALSKRSAKGLLPNLWEFPNMEGHVSLMECQRLLLEEGIPVLDIEPLKPSRHRFSHREWDMIAYRIITEEIKGPESWVWITSEERKRQYSVPTAFREYWNE